MFRLRFTVFYSPYLKIHEQDKLMWLVAVLASLARSSEEAILNIGACKLSAGADATVLRSTCSVAVPDAKDLGDLHQTLVTSTKDIGEWVPVTAEMLTVEANASAHVEIETNDKGEMHINVTEDDPSGSGCNGWNGAFLSVAVPGATWTRIKYTTTFHQRASCWSIFGDSRYAGNIDPGLAPFEPRLDAYSGNLIGFLADGSGHPTMACNNECSTNFLHACRENQPTPVRATVELRRTRASRNRTAGILTGLDCTNRPPIGQPMFTYSEVHVWVPYNQGVLMLEQTTFWPDAAPVNALAAVAATKDAKIAALEQQVATLRTELAAIRQFVGMTAWVGPGSPPTPHGCCRGSPIHSTTTGVIDETVCRNACAEASTCAAYEYNAAVEGGMCELHESTPTHVDANASPTCICRVKPS